MNHLVPDLDASYQALSHQSPSSHWQQSGKGQTDEEERGLLKQRKQTSTFVPDNFSKQIPWIERESEDNQTHVHAMSRESALSVDAPLSNMTHHEDEMLSWLQYPLDDSFTKNYCSEQLFEQTTISHFAKGLLPGPVLVEGEKPPLASCQSQLWELSASNVDGRTPADVAMAIGAQRAAGVLPPDGSEILDRVEMAQASGSPVSCLPKDTDTFRCSNKGVDHDSYYGLRSQDVSKPNAVNFSFFSQHVAAMKSNLQILGTSSGPSNMDRVKQPQSLQKKQDSPSMAQSTAITGIASLTSPSLLAESDSIEHSKKVIEQTSAAAHRRIQDLMPSSRCEHIGGKAMIEFNARAGAMSMDVLEMGDVPLTSPSGSGYSTEKSAKDMFTCYPQAQATSVEDYECDSKDLAEGVASEHKHPSLNGLNSAKRRRAAEIHNQSERRRRNKINEKMKALQELIPNANKTDKASMLDEAIEYVKMLQGQLQLMSMRTGMVVPPVMMPPGLQYLSMQQSPGSSLTNMGMGMSPGFGMGMGRGVFDASAHGVRPSTLPVMGMPPFFGPPVAGHAYQVPMGSSSFVPEAQGLKNIVGQQHAFPNQQPLHSQMTDDTYRACTEQNVTGEGSNNINKKP